MRRDRLKTLAVIVHSMPKRRSHRRIAFSSIASNTGARSPGEELMTCKTSAVAVCCSGLVALGASRSASCALQIG